jgi:predicted GH43/DUF377 family glycosyl hydrolase
LGSDKRFFGMSEKTANERAKFLLGIFLKGKRIIRFYKILRKGEALLKMESSLDGLDFRPYPRNPEILSRREKEDIGRCRDFKISEIDGKYVLTYLASSEKGTNLCIAVSEDAVHWEKLENIDSIKESGMVVPNYKHDGKYCLIFGKDSLRCAFSPDMKKWQIEKEPIIAPKSSGLGTASFFLGGLANDHGIHMTYYANEIRNGLSRQSSFITVLDNDDPRKIVWRSKDPVWEREFPTGKEMRPIGIVNFGGKLISYWEGGAEILAFPHTLPKPGAKPIFTCAHLTPVLEKSAENPILKPEARNVWESKYVFNPAAVYEGGKVHLIYRAIGDADISVLGYASSQDGVHFDEKLDEPAYVPSQPFECNPSAPCAYVPFMSGGGCGGCEDPRITKIGDRLYMTYVAFDGGSPPRVALTSINVDDFLNKRWNWNIPVLISPPGVVDKNAAILPEKINGKYVIFHRIFPNILIDFVDDLDFGGNQYLKGEYAIKPTKNGWDSRKIGVGAPPIKTKDGWLLIYQAVGDKDPHYRYKIGAMLLDARDPTKVLFRSKEPILEPREWYEMEGFKPGVTYPAERLSQEAICTFITAAPTRQYASPPRILTNSWKS